MQVETITHVNLDDKFKYVIVNNHYARVYSRSIINEDVAKEVLKVGSKLPFVIQNLIKEELKNTEWLEEYRYCNISLLKN